MTKQEMFQWAAPVIAAVSAKCKKPTGEMITEQRTKEFNLEITMGYVTAQTTLAEIRSFDSQFVDHFGFHPGIHFSWWFGESHLPPGEFDFSTLFRIQVSAKADIHGWVSHAEKILAEQRN